MPFTPDATKHCLTDDCNRCPCVDFHEDLPIFHHHCCLERLGCWIPEWVQCVLLSLVMVILLCPVDRLTLT